jgi:serine/threonine protein kinase
MPNIPKVIGEGTYGCVHKPALKCKNKKIANHGRISKTMLTRHALTEMGEYNIISAADKENAYHLGKPIMCSVANTQSNIDAIGKCNKKQNFANINDVSLLIMKDGGESLEDFSDSMKNNAINSDNQEKMEHFWLDMHNILLGIKQMNQSDIVHHDLKPQNIVYNQKTRETNIIDFGIMMGKPYMLDASNKSSYPYNFIHWSFPFELIFYNKNAYDSIVNSSKSKQIQFYNQMISNFHLLSNDAYSENFRIFFNYMKYSKHGDEYNKNMIKKYWSDFFTLTLELNKIDYFTFLNKSMETIDTYGLGIAISKVLSETHKHIDDILSNRLHKFSYDLTTPNLKKRLNPNNALGEYEKILEETGILLKYGLQFKDNKLLKTINDNSANQPYLPSSPNIPKSVAKNINSIRLEDISMNKQKISQIVKKDIRECPPDKDLNPITRRCNKKCDPGKIRNDLFKCVSLKNQIQKIQKNDFQICPPGKEINPKTRRCNKLCKQGYVRNSDFKCVSAATNRTRKNKNI